MTVLSWGTPEEFNELAALWRAVGEAKAQLAEHEALARKIESDLFAFLTRRAPDAKAAFEAFAAGKDSPPPVTGPTRPELEARQAGAKLAISADRELIKEARGAFLARRLEVEKACTERAVRAFASLIEQAAPIYEAIAGAQEQIRADSGGSVELVDSAQWRDCRVPGSKPLGLGRDVGDHHHTHLLIGAEPYDRVQMRAGDELEAARAAMTGVEASAIRTAAHSYAVPQQPQPHPKNTRRAALEKAAERIAP